MVEPRSHDRIIHGRTHSDPWSWIDITAADAPAADRATVTELVAAENAWCDQVMAGTEELQQRIVDEITRRTVETDVSAPVRRGHYWYATRTFEGVDYPRHIRIPVTDGEDGYPTLDPRVVRDDEEILLDQAERAGDADFYSAPMLEISDDERLCAWLEDRSGGEVFDIIVRDIASGDIVDDAVTGAHYGLVLAGDWVYYMRCDDAWRAHQVWAHRLGTSASDDILVFEEPDERFETGVRRSDDDRWIVIESYARLSTRMYLLPVGAPVQPRPVYDWEPTLIVEVECAGDHLLINHNRERANQTLAVAALSVGVDDFTPITPEPSTHTPGRADDRAIAPVDTWCELGVPNREDERLISMTAHRTFTAVELRSGGQQQVAILNRRDGANDGALYQPPVLIDTDAQVRRIEVIGANEWDSECVRVVVDSPIQPPTTIDYYAHSGRSVVVKTLEAPGFDSADYRSEQVWVPSRDGVRIPVSLYYRSDVRPDGTNPVLLYGYGSYEVSMDARFTATRTTLIERGVVYAIAHIRGGGEMGRAWYEDGKFERKTNTFNDFVDVTRWLVESGWAKPGRIVAEGGSAGGLLMGAIANQAPELYAGVVAHVPFVDALNTILDPAKPLTVGEWDEWGNPVESPEIFDVMRSYSPYDNVREVAYPAIYATTSLNDIRVCYVEPLKWMQRLRHVSKVGESNPVACRIQEVAGHAGGSGRTKARAEFGEAAAFMLRALGVIERN